LSRNLVKMQYAVNDAPRLAPNSSHSRQLALLFSESLVTTWGCRVKIGWTDA
jgi:hypothetical protein